MIKQLKSIMCWFLRLLTTLPHFVWYHQSICTIQSFCQFPLRWVPTSDQINSSSRSQKFPDQARQLLGIISWSTRPLLDQYPMATLLLLDFFWQSKIIASETRSMPTTPTTCQTGSWSLGRVDLISSGKPPLCTISSSSSLSSIIIIHI